MPFLKKRMSLCLNWTVRVLINQDAMAYSPGRILNQKAMIIRSAIADTCGVFLHWQNLAAHWISRIGRVNLGLGAGSVVSRQKGSSMLVEPQYWRGLHILPGQWSMPLDRGWFLVFEIRLDGFNCSSPPVLCSKTEEGVILYHGGVLLQLGVSLCV